jgi:hypothetical protein
MAQGELRAEPDFPPVKLRANRCFMRTISFAALLAILCANHVWSAPDPWDGVLAAAGLTAKTAQLDPNRWTGGGLYRLDSFQRLWDDWRLVDPTAIQWGHAALAASGSFSQLVAFGADRIGVKLTPKQATSVRPVDEPLARAIRGLHSTLGKPLSVAEAMDLRAKAAAVPPSIQRAAAMILNAVPAAIQARDRAFAKFGDRSKLPVAYAAALKLAQQTDVDDNVLRLMDTIDLSSLVNGGVSLAGAIDGAAAMLGPDANARFSFEWNTPVGKVCLNGTQDNTYPAGAYLLVIDSGGNNHFGAGVAAGSVDVPVSVAISLAGSNVYEAKDGLGAGTGVCGYGFLLDCAGNSRYETAGPGLGTGIFGVGVLIDRAGKGAYRASQLGEGAGVFGVGALSDLSGGDTYYCLTQSQGYAGPKGSGLLVNGDGDNSYEAEDTKITNPSPQTGEHNVSLAQGCGFGRRAHPGDGHSLAGGVGMLVNAAGGNRFKCGVFGQGVAYWYSVGFLVNFGGGNDYLGMWYVQGAAAHYSVGALCDLGGGSHYAARMTQSEGHGHDYSIGVLHDGGGDSTFECPSNCLGAGIWNGIGVFWKQAGSAVYKTGDAALGFVADSRPESTCIGLFADDTGKATFPANSPAKPHSTWVRPPVPGRPNAHAAGIAR